MEAKLFVASSWLTLTQPRSLGTAALFGGGSSSTREPGMRRKLGMRCWRIGGGARILGSVPLYGVERTHDTSCRRRECLDVGAVLGTGIG